MYYYPGNDFISEVIYSIGRICEPCLEHTDNNFNPLQEAQKEEFKHISEGITDFLEQARNIILQNDYTNFDQQSCPIKTCRAETDTRTNRKSEGEHGISYNDTRSSKCRSLHQQFTESQPKISSRRIILKRFIKRVRTLNERTLLF